MLCPCISKAGASGWKCLTLKDCGKNRQLKYKRAFKHGHRFYPRHLCSAPCCLGLHYAALLLQMRRLAEVAPWMTDSLQHHICTFEQLGQCLLLLLTYRLLHYRRQHCTLITACDNTASEVAATKGLSSSIGLHTFCRISSSSSGFLGYCRKFVTFRDIEMTLRMLSADFILTAFRKHVNARSFGHVFSRSLTLSVQPESSDISSSFAAAKGCQILPKIQR